MTKIWTINTRKLIVHLIEIYKTHDSFTVSQEFHLRQPQLCTRYLHFLKHELDTRKRKIRLFVWSQRYFRNLITVWKGVTTREYKSWDIEATFISELFNVTNVQLQSCIATSQLALHMRQQLTVCSTKDAR